MSSSPPTSDLRSPTSSSEGEVLVRVEGVSKIFCRDLKKSLLYGLQDSARDLMSWGKRPEIRGRKSEIGSQRSDPSDSSLTSDLRSPTSESRALRAGEFLAVDNVSFELKRGECLGLIGRNGAGKTTLLKMLNGLIKPDSGRIEMRGRVGALIALGAGFNPILSGRENVYVNGSILGLTKKEIDAKIDGIIDFAEIGEFIDAPVQTYSSGMQVRLGFAVATAMEPDILIVDEVLAVGDINFRVKCYNRLRSILPNTVVIIVSHSMFDILKMSSCIMVVDRGEMLHFGSTEKGISVYNQVNIDESPEERLVYTSDENIDKVNLVTFDVVSGNRGSSITLVLEVMAFSALGHVSYRIVFFDSSEIPVAEWNSADYEECFSIAEGLNRHEISMTEIRLVTGSYRIVVVLADSMDQGYYFRIDQGIRAHLHMKVAGGPAYRI